MLYAIVDPEQSRGRDVVQLARLVLDGGASFLQLRAKKLDDAAHLTLARELRALTRGRAVFVVNDRADIAALCDADVVHVGQDDLSVEEARRSLKPHQKIGVSTHDEAQVKKAVLDGADMLGFGPVFQSGTKSGHAPVVGTEGLARAVMAAGRVPVIAIGGVTTENAEACARAGAASVAVIGALASAEDPAKAARDILTAFKRGKA